MAAEYLLTDSASRIFADFCDKPALDAAESGQFPEALLKVVVDNGLHEMGLRDSGVSLPELFAVIKASARYALPLHLPEIVFANRWLNESLSSVSVGSRTPTGARDVPWGRVSNRILAVDESGVVPVTATDTVQGSNLAGEARDEVSGAHGAPLDIDDNALALLALARTLQMAGTLEKVLELSLQYANDREQFGRPIAKFQAIQHSLAVMATEVAAASRAADAAADALTGANAPRLELEVAAAKARVGEACGSVAEMAHQVHGAMGYTHEHQLHHFTRRLWAWRDEYGAEAHWQARLGRHVAGLGADALWGFVATRG